MQASCLHPFESIVLTWAPVFGGRSGEVERLLEADHLGRRTEALEAGAFLFQLIVGVTNGLDGKSDAALDLVHLDDAGFDLFADLDDVFDLFHMVFAELRNVDEAVDVTIEADEGTKGCDLRNGALDEVANLEAVVDEAPWIAFGLLDTEGNALVCLVDGEHDGFHFVVLFENFGWVVDLAGPGHVRNVDHTIDAFFEFHERTVSSEVADRPLDGGADRIAHFDFIPWVGIELTHAERDLLLLDADAENDGLDFLADFQNIGWTGDALDPAEFGNVDKTFDAALDFDERAVGKKLGDAALDVVTDRVFPLDVFPWVLRHLLKAERNALFLLVHVEDDDIHGLADVKKLGRMVDAAPRHVGDVEESIHALEIDEGTEIGDVLDRAGDFVADFDTGEESLTQLGTLCLDDFAAGNDDVFTLVVDFNDFEFVNVADVFVEILRWDDVHLGAWKEGLDADIDGESAFDDSFDLAADETAVLEDFDDFFPILFVGGFLFGQDNHALVVFEFLEKHFDFVADFDFFILELIRWDGSFGFVADIYKNDLGADFENRALDDRSRVEFAKFGIDKVVQFFVRGFRACVSHMFTWFGVVLLVRFPSAIAPERGNTDRHRGANRLPAKRKTDAETRRLNRYGKAKGTCF